MKGIIFDMDGVIVDNHSFHFEAWMEFSRRHKFELNAQIYRDRFNGKTNRDLFQMIFGEISPEKIEILSEEKEGLYQQLYKESMIAHKGLVDFLEYLKMRKFKIALGTSAPTSNVDFVMDGLFLRQYFDVIVDGTMVSQGKPHPEIYLKASSMLDLDPSECFVFEDSLAGLESGKRAGCKIIGVATSHEAFELRPMTDLIIYDFTEARKLLQYH
jgi:beta-phosphoglucomutase